MFSNILKAFSIFWAALVNTAKIFWKKLTVLEQTFLANASGIFAIINANLDKSGTDIIALIAAKYPNLDLGFLQGAMQAILKALGILLPGSDFPTDLAGVIEVYKVFLSAHSGDSWVTETQQLVVLLAKQFTPGTPVQKLILALEYAYQDVVKPFLALTA